jgi:hypothetical protein
MYKPWTCYVDSADQQRCKHPSGELNLALEFIRNLPWSIKKQLVTLSVGWAVSKFQSMITGNLV